jgi:hypothetical protein
MKNRNVMDRWTETARGAVPAKAAMQGKPKGELELLFQMEAEWSRIPNTCFEDEAGRLWLADAKLRSNPIQIDTERGYEAVTGEEFLDWMLHVLEFVEGYDGDPVDICRIALREIRSRPTGVQRVKKAMREELTGRSKRA